MYLIEHGAVYYNRIPISSAGGYKIEVDTARTNLVYNQCMDLLNLQYKLDYLMGEIEQLKNKSK